MKITFLGTGTSQGVPVIACECEVCKSLDFRDKRLRVSIHIEFGGKSFVVDTGPDFRQQMLRERVQSLDAILFTHEHKDHTAGLDDIRAFNYKQQKPMPVYARKQVMEQLKKEFSYAFDEHKYPGIPEINLLELKNEPLEIEGIRFVPIEVKHMYLPVFGFRVGNFTYLTDLNFISDEELEKVKGSEVVVIGALQKAAHQSHFRLDEAIALLEKLKPRKGYLTHISHRMGLHADVSKELPEFIELAYDGLKIQL
ncbi:MAG: MBL fold metallo-hydrolase [Cytophagales bacterium]|nr:MBL fold metallo-hydrolase [Cytophagales bacterium]